MRTEGGRYDSTRDEDWVTLASLESAISTTAKVDEGQMNLRRRLSLTTLVIDLAMTVRRSIKKLRAVNRQNELEFVMVTP